MMASIITAMNLTGFAMVRDDLRSISLSPDESASRAITTSNNASDTTAPIIDALDIVIPYSTALRSEEMGTITDDQDVSPKLEIVSVLEASANNSQNTTTAEGSTLAETASPVEDTDSEDAAATSEASTTSATADATAGTTAADPGYLFSTPGQYNVVLKGTDKRV